MSKVLGTTNEAGQAAVEGINENHTQNAGPGVYGKSDGTGVWGVSETWHGVAGFSNSKTGGVGIYGEGRGDGIQKGMGPAALFLGDVFVEIKSLPHYTVTRISIFDLYAAITKLQLKVEELERRIR